MPARALGRLRKGPEFDDAYREGTVLNGPLFVLRKRANALNHDRWGFAVGKKLAPHAVVRNRTRRQLRAAAATTQRAPAPPPEGDGPHFDIIVTAKSALLTAPYTRIASELSRMVAHTVPAGPPR